MNSSMSGNYGYAFSGLALSLCLSMALALCTANSEAQSVSAVPPARGVSGAGTGSPAAARVRVESITISGNQALPASELQRLVAGMVGAEHSLDQLNAAARRITAYYRERGFAAARAQLARQDISDGTISILVAEGRAAGRHEAAAGPAAEARHEPRAGERGLLLLQLLRSQR